MISGRDIVYISSIDWNFVWHSPQEIALRLAAAGNRVLFVENMGVRAPSPRDFRRVGNRLQHWAASLASSGAREVAPNLYTCSPLVLPPFGSPLSREANRRLFLALVRRAVRRLGMRDIVFWTYLPTDTTLDLIKSLRSPKSLLAYYCISDFAQLTPQVGRLRQSEEAMLSACDVVFTNCSELAVRFSPHNANVHVFPVGVNLDAFPLNGEGRHATPSANGRARPPGFNGSLRRPIVGYVGGLHKHVDLDLLVEMARARPEWSWVFVGPVQTPLGELATLPNVHLAGQHRHDELVHFIRDFDVGIVPYVNSEYTTTVVPTKINEYLAVGKPVVSTELPTVMEFNREHGVLQTSPARADSFLQAVERALGTAHDPEAARARRRVAALGDWETRFAEMTRLIELQEAKKNLG